MAVFNVHYNYSVLLVAILNTFVAFK
jgi:hypothetical protein